MEDYEEDDPVLMWQPDRNKTTNMDEFRASVNKYYGYQFTTYQELYEWSINSYQEFWERFWHYSNIIYSKSYTKVIDHDKMISVPSWFCDSRLNYAENLLKYDDDQIAIIATGEGKEIEEVTFHELRRRVTILASALKKIGIKKGDRVAGYLPNCSLAIVAMLATTSLGAIWSSTSPDFGSLGVLDRFMQIEPTVLFSVNAVVYNGKVHDHMTKLAEVVKGLPSLEKVVVSPFHGCHDNIDLTKIPQSIFYEEFLGYFSTSDELTFEQVPFNHPLFIMYSSGTTGKPKCLVHSVGGTLIQHLKEHSLHGNMSRDDVIMFYTTTGWMMWNWLVTALAVGATVLLYDGSPITPTPNVLFDLVDKHSMTIFGTSPKFLETLQSKKVVPKETNNLSSLHTILSTGAPLTPASYDFVYNKIKKDVLLGSISGGTDIISCFMGQNPTVPVYRGQIQSCNLGMAIQSWDPHGKPSYDKRGELVCTKPFPCMPIYFWNDDDNAKYYNAYFAKYKGVWCHGDFCVISSKTKGIIMLGRSDGTLNPNGVRFGSAEIYNVVGSLDEVEDSLCVGYTNNLKEEHVVLFVKMANGHRFNEALVKKLKNEVRQKLSPRHVPSKIIETHDIPYTTNGKKVEVEVKKILAGAKVSYTVAYRNPECLDFYSSLKELENW